MITLVKKPVAVIGLHELPQATFEQFEDWLEMREGHEIPTHDVPSGLRTRLKNSPVLPSRIRWQWSEITHFQFLD